MDDLTKSITVNSAPLKQAKQDKWLNKDRFWNFVFCLLSICGWQLTSFLNDKNLSFVTSWLTLLGVPLLVRYFSKTTFVKDTIFLTSEGREFDVAKVLPNKLLTIVSTLVLIALTGVILDKKLLQVPDAVSFFIFTMIFFGVPTLFFIFKNCPVSILFNYKFWTLERCYTEQSNSNNDYYSRVRNNSIFIGRPENIYIDRKKR